MTDQITEQMTEAQKLLEAQPEQVSTQTDEDVGQETAETVLI